MKYYINIMYHQVLYDRNICSPRVKLCQPVRLNEHWLYFKFIYSGKRRVKSFHMSNLYFNIFASRNFA